jgi:uncharacterized protein YjbI with pentapeptide repeats
MKLHYTNEDIKNAKKVLKNYFVKGVGNNNEYFKNSKGKIFNSNYYGASLKRNYVIDAIFENADLTFVAFTGSKFENTKFINNKINGASFQFSEFIKTTFDTNKVINGNNFCQCHFYLCNFNKAKFKGNTFSQSTFEKTKFSKTIFNSVTFENSTFIECEFENIDLSQLNLDYILIKNCKMNDVVLPLYQMPYTIGGLQYILNTNDKIYINTDKGKKTILEYRNILYSLQPYFYEKREYFPLANIAFALNENELGKEYFNLGINQAISNFDFRLIKHYCRLAKYIGIVDSNFSDNIIGKLNDFLIENKTDINQMNHYLLHIENIRELLFNQDENKRKVEIRLKTNISKNDKDKINELINEINYIVDKHKTNNDLFYLEIRHDSPWDILFNFISNNLSTILSIVGIIITIVLSKSNTKDSNSDVVKERKIILSKQIKNKKIHKKLILKKIKDLKKRLKTNKSMKEYIELFTAHITGSFDAEIQKDMESILLIKKENLKN